MGVRPFYYFRSASLFAFGSEIRALLALPGVPRRLNESRVVDFLVEALDREDKESTFYGDILRLPAGHCLTISTERFEIRDYWNLKAPPTLKLGSLEEYGEAFREVFVEAVRSRLRSSHRVGSTLSGGIDSSSVVCTMRELLRIELREPLHTISLVDADESRCGETPYIREVLRGDWIVPHIVRSDQVWDLERELTAADEPFELGRYFPIFFIATAARSAGVRVLLDGISGDHITAPFSYLSILLRSFRWKMLASELSFAAKAHGEPVFQNLFLRGIGPLLPNLSVGLRKRLRRLRKNPLVEDTLINQDFATRMDVSGRFEMCTRRAWKNAQEIGKLHSGSFTSGVLPFYFEQSGRLAAMQGIETRHPFCDRRTIEFFLSLPLKMKTFAPVPKRVIREAMKGILPEMVRNRTRFAHPAQAFSFSLIAHSSIISETQEFKDILDPLSRYVNVKKVEALTRPASDGSPQDGYSLWQIFALGMWLRANGN